MKCKRCGALVKVEGHCDVCRPFVYPKGGKK